jgi:glutamate 5-kinase
VSARRAAARARTLVVKVGSATLTDGGRLRTRLVTSLARQISALADEGRRVVLVSSGAIAVGSRALAWDHTGRTIPEKQAAAAVGQIGLCEIYQRRFARFGRRVGQVLVTRLGLEDRERYLNARHTLTTLLDLGVIPIVNENDTVATEEIRFGDNDNLSATIVDVVGAELLVILTDVEGLYERPPVAGEPTPRLLARVEAVTPELAARAGGAGSAFGRGGMATKLQAAASAGRSGAATVLCNGRRPDVLLRVARGEELGTLVLPGPRIASRKHWLAFTARPRGTLALDEGAVRALRERGRSLLPAGVV